MYCPAAPLYCPAAQPLSASRACAARTLKRRRPIPGHAIAAVGALLKEQSVGHARRSGASQSPENGPRRTGASAFRSRTALTLAHSSVGGSRRTRAARSVFYPQDHVGCGWGIRNGAIGAVRLPTILVLTIDDFVSAQAALGLEAGVDMDNMCSKNDDGTWTYQHIEQALAEGLVHEKRINESCSRVLAQKFAARPAATTYQDYHLCVVILIELRERPRFVPGLPLVL